MSHGGNKGRRRFVLLDRDGTVIVDRDYLADPAGVALMAGAAEGLRRLQELGLGLAILSNQSGVGRGYFDTADVARVNDRMRELLAARGVRLDGVYFCPHAPDAGCRCRKPRAGMAEQAAQELGFEPVSCFVIGDRPADIGLGHAIGAVTLLIGGSSDDATPRPDHVVVDLRRAARLIEAELGRERPAHRAPTFR